MIRACFALLVSCTTYHATIRITPGREYRAIHQFTSDWENVGISLGICGADPASVDEHQDGSSFHVEVSCTQPGLDPDTQQPILFR